MTTTENVLPLELSNRFVENAKIEIKEGEFDEEQSEIRFIKAPM